MIRPVRSWSTIAVLLTIMGCKTMSSSTSPQQIRQLVTELYAAWSLHEPDRIDAIFTDDAAYEDVAGGQVLHGKPEIKQLLRATFTWAPDFRVTMTSLTIAGDAGTTEWVIEGTQTGPVRAGPYGELPATGRPFRLRGASVLLFRGARIAKVTDYYDMATFLGELGATVAIPKP